MEEFESRAMPSANPAYTEITGASNPLNGLDVGTYSTPRFADLDGDGDLDLCVGETNGQLFYFENTGAAGSPAFTQRTGAANPFNGLDVGSYSSPAFGDLDGDGDLDLVSGTQPGTLLYYRNTGTASSPTFVQQTGAANPFNGFDVGNFSIPEFGDLDGDGDLDLVSGDTIGMIHYFKNTGTAVSPTFAQQTGAANPFNGFDVGAAGSTTALGDVDGDGDLDLAVGESSGVQFYFKNTGTAGSPAFAQQTGAANPFNGFDVGSFSAPAFGDLNGDGAIDLVSGNSFGSLNYYRSAPGLAASVSSLNLGTTTAGTAGTTQTFTVSGIALTANLVVTAPTGVELSNDGGTSWHASLSLTPTSDKVADTTISARIAAAASAGAVSGNITVASTGATTRNVSVSGTVNAPDTTPPTATLAVSDTALKIGDTATVTVTFSEAVTGFTTADLIVANGVVTGLSSGDGGITWTGTLTPSAGVTDAMNVIDLDLTGVQDAAGNAGVGTSSSNNYAIDTERPTATVTVTDTSLIVGETSLVTITFSEGVTGLTAADLTVANGAVSGLSTGDGGVTWTATLTPSAGVTDATNLIDLDLTGVQDAAGNAGVGTESSNNYAVDTLAPTATVTVADAALIVGDTATVTFTFSEAVTGFTTADLSVANGAVSGLSSSDGGVTWTATLTPSAGVTDATNLIDLDLTGVQDAAGNAGVGTESSNNYAVDTEAPTATVTSAAPAVTGASPIPVTVTFSEPVTGFTAVGVTVGNGMVSNFVGSGTTYTFDVTPSGEGAVTVDVGAGAGQDAGGNGNTAATQLTRTFDSLAPTAAVTTPAAAISAATGGTSTNTITVTYADGGSVVDATTFGTDDLTVTNGATITGFSVAGNVVTYTITAPAATWAGSTQGTYTIALAAGGVADLAGNPIAADLALSSFTVDTTVVIPVPVAPPETSPPPSTSPQVSSPVFVATAPRSGPNGTEIKVFDPATGLNTRTMVPFVGFHGTVDVSVGDFDGNGVADVVIGAGASGGPRVVVLDGATGATLASFFAFDSGFTGGVDVAVGDVTGDGTPDLIVAAGPGGGPHVKVYDGKSFVEVMSFFAYSSTFLGGVNVAAADVNGDGKADIVTGAGPGAGPHVKAFSGADLAVLFSFFAFPSAFGGGVNVAAGDVNGDGFADLIAGAGAGGTPQVSVYDGTDGSNRGSWLAFTTQFRGGVTVGATDADGDGKADIVAAAGPGGGPHVVTFDGETFALLSSTYAFGADLLGGVSVS